MSATIGTITCDTLTGAVSAPGATAAAIAKQGQDGEIIVTGPSRGRRVTLVTRHIAATHAAAAAVLTAAQALIGTQQTVTYVSTHTALVYVLDVVLRENRATRSNGTKYRATLEWSVISTDAT